jgi:hypothetical protein
MQTTENHLTYNPAPPTRISELDIPEALVVDLVLRRAMLDGTTSLRGLSVALKLTVPVVEAVFRHLRDQKMLEVKGMEGDDYVFTLTQAGRSLASDRFRVSQYAAAAPVSLRQYQQAVGLQTAKVEVNRSRLRRALHDMVVPDRLLDELGPAIISQSSIFLYGPSGNGKTSIAERLRRVYSDRILIPHAVEVDGQVISLYDPVLHWALPEQPWEVDPRWVVCERPCVLVGGELVSSMLELRLDSSTGTYSAPLQMKANNGIFIIDDFGRQMMSPRELLNRWIVPLDRRVDYLSLSYGVKFPIPFELVVIFSTNLDPRELADDAFFRRIQNKIYIDPVSPDIFEEILFRVTRERNIPVAPGAQKYVREQCMQLGNRELRACYPADICKILEAIAVYERRPVRMSMEEVDRALSLYFAPIE